MKSIFTLTRVGDGTARGLDETQCIGWFLTLKEAQDALKSERTDIHEGFYYTLAVIEEMGEGLFPQARQAQWWWLDEGEWKLSKRNPFEGITNFSMG